MVVIAAIVAAWIAHQIGLPAGTHESQIAPWSPPSQEIINDPGPSPIRIRQGIPPVGHRKTLLNWEPLHTATTAAPCAVRLGKVCWRDGVPHRAPAGGGV